MERVLKANSLLVPAGIILEPEDFEELKNDAEEWAEDYIVGHVRSNQATPFSWNGIWFYSRDSRLAPTEILNRYHETLTQYARHFWNCPMFNPSQRDREAGVKCDCDAKPALEALGLPTHC
jgi:hypothetical protein